MPQPGEATPLTCSFSLRGSSGEHFLSELGGVVGYFVEVTVLRIEVPAQFAIPFASNGRAIGREQRFPMFRRILWLRVIWMGMCVGLHFFVLAL